MKRNAARMISSMSVQFENFVFGTPQYIAPEVQLNYHNTNKNSCDIWSFGIILYELIYKHHPFTIECGKVKVSEIKKFVTK